MENEKVRQFFLDNKELASLDNNMIESLEKLSLFHNKALNLEKFMKDLSIILDWNTVNNIAYIIGAGKKPENTTKIISIHTWAKRSFSDALQSGNIDKLILSYLLGQYLFLEPIKDFQWETPNNGIEGILKDLITKVTVQTIFPENTPFSEKKYYIDYCDSLKNGSHKKIFDYLYFIERGKGYDYRFKNYINALTIISYKINPKMISEAIENIEPILIRIILNSLNPNQINAVLREYNGKPVLPLLIGLVNIVNSSFNNDSYFSLEKDYDFIGEASLIIKKIADRTETDNLFNHINEATNISGNKLWHSIFIAFGIQNPIFLDSYVNCIDFSYDLGAENIFDTFCHFITDEALLDEFSMKICTKYMNYLEKERSFIYNYCGTNYLRFMIRAAYVKSEKSIIKYSEMLKEVSIDFERTLYSWDKSKITMYFTKLIIWILALSYLYDETCYDKIDLSYTINILSNEKYLDTFNTKSGDVDIDYSKFADFLKNPAAHNIITLPLSHDSYTNIEFNGKKMISYLKKY